MLRSNVTGGKSGPTPASYLSGRYGEAAFISAADQSLPIDGARGTSAIRRKGRTGDVIWLAASLARMSGATSGILSPPRIRFPAFRCAHAGCFAATIQKCPQSPRVSGNKVRIKARVTLMAPGHQTKSEKRLSSDQRDGSIRRNFLIPRRAAN
jgi:hypothetical protein